jgi:hypothetical protein
MWVVGFPQNAKNSPEICSIGRGRIGIFIDKPACPEKLGARPQQTEGQAGLLLWLTS